MTCIFSYSEFSAFGNIDDYDAFRVDIMNNGTIYYISFNIYDFFISNMFI